jgi:hypothetical protein
MADVAACWMMLGPGTTSTCSVGKFTCPHRPVSLSLESNSRIVVHENGYLLLGEQSNKSVSQSGPMDTSYDCMSLKKYALHVSGGKCGMFSFLHV